MKRWMVMAVVASVVALIAGLPTSGFAADNQVPQDTLALMGLSGLQQQPDAAGMEVRGKGFAFVGGFSRSYAWPQNSAFALFGAGSRRPNAVAVGASLTVSNGFFGTNGSLGGAFAYGR